MIDCLDCLLDNYLTFSNISSAQALVTGQVTQVMLLGCIWIASFDKVRIRDFHRSLFAS